MARTGITIVLEFDEMGDSPLGTARLTDGTSRPFRGWLALVEAIDALAAPSSTGDGPEQGPPPVLPTQGPEVPTT